MKVLIIFDLDETLVRVQERPLSRAPDFHIDNSLYGYKRPHMLRLLRVATRLFDDVAFWTIGSRRYADEVLSHLLPATHEPYFVWSREKATRRVAASTEYTPEQAGHEVYFRKYLYKVKGYDRSNIIAVDDRYESYEHDYGNLLLVRPFTGAASDDELLRLARYLPIVRKRIVSHVHRDVDLRNWRKHIRL